MDFDFGFIHLDLRNETPISDQIAEQLRIEIQQGQIQPGAWLPTVRQLASQLKINFNTVARAYRILDSEGLILSRQGQGSFVIEKQVEGKTNSAEAPAQVEEALSVQEQMDRLVNDMESLARAAGLEMADVIAHIQGSIVIPEKHPRKMKRRKNALVRRKVLNSYLSILEAVVRKRRASSRPVRGKKKKR